jgi:hypothetical protein
MPTLSSRRARCSWLSLLCVGYFVGLFATRAEAVQLGNPDDFLSLEIHAFGSQGFMFSTSNNYLATGTTRGSFEFTEIGLNFTKQLTDKLRAGFQLFTEKIGTIGDFNIKADWFYLDYRWKDWLGFRAGRTKLPFGLYNDSADIDAARVPILLPQSVYPIQNRDYLLAQNGAEIYGYIPMRKAGVLEYRIYGGTIFVDTPAYIPGEPATITSLNVPYIAGGRLMWDTPINGLRLGGSVQALRLNTKILVGPGTTAPAAATIEYDLPLVLWIASAEYSAHRFLFAGEYSRWYATSRSSNTAIEPNAHQTQERSYIMGAYRVNRIFQPGLYYSAYLPDAYKRHGRENVQHDAAATLRFDVNSFWIIKVEGHFMGGTAVLDPTLNNNTPLTQLTRYWGFMLAKTTVYF